MCPCTGRPSRLPAARRWRWIVDSRLLVTDSDIHLHETECPEEAGRGLVLGGDLDLDNGEVLLLQVPEQLGQEELAEPLTAQIVADQDIEHTGRRGTPPPAVISHFPEQGLGGRLPG